MAEAKLSLAGKHFIAFVGRGYITFLYLLFALAAHSQPNLVPNGSFEQFTQCPSQGSQFEAYITDWYNPSDSVPIIPTPDAYNACSNPSDYGVPNNITGTLSAKDGNGYVGIFLVKPNVFPLCNFREYISIKLVSALIKDSLYNMKFSISYSQKYNGIALSNIAAVLWKDSLKQYISCPISIPDSATVLRNNPDSIIHNPGNWKVFSFDFKANGEEQFLCIGNFNNDLELDSIHYSSIPSGYEEHSYYLIDDVSLTRATSVGLNENNVTKNLLVYPNPAQEFVSITIPTIHINAQLSIFNLTGQLISQKQITQSNQQITISDLGNGMYIFVIQNEDKIIGRQRLVVAR